MRLSAAFDAGLPRPSQLVGFRPEPDFEFAGISPLVVHGSFVACQEWLARGAEVRQDAPVSAEMSLVCLPRSKVLAKDLIAQAARISSDWIVVDGQKTDGVDSIYKAIRTQVDIGGTITKAHGRLFWFRAAELPEFRAEPSFVNGLRTAPGLFSADKVDPGSQALIQALPQKLPGHVADFGAGWGYLTREVLQRGADHVSAIEVEAAGVDAIRANFDDARLEVHWGDATRPSGPYDLVVTNPPFHRGRAGAPDLGQEFIRSAAASLTRTGQLWLVANRHLPYEATLAASFGEVSVALEVPGFKVFHAGRPKSARATR